MRRRRNRDEEGCVCSRQQQPKHSHRARAHSLSIGEAARGGFSPSKHQLHTRVCTCPTKRCRSRRLSRIFGAFARVLVRKKGDFSHALALLDLAAPLLLWIEELTYGATVLIGRNSRKATRPLRYTRPSTTIMPRVETAPPCSSTRNKRGVETEKKGLRPTTLEK